jgi:hypothetical protein
MRVMTVNDYLLEVVNERLRARGEDVQLVWERPRPRAVEDDNVVSFAPKGGEPIQC